MTQLLFQRRAIAMRIHVHRGPREPAPIDNAGVVQLVAEDGVVATYERRDRPDVGREPEAVCRAGGEGERPSAAAPPSFPAHTALRDS